MNEQEIMDSLREAVINGKRDEAARLAREAIDRGVPPLDTIMKACYPAMSRVGELYQDGEYFIPEMLMSAKAFEAVMGVVEPHLETDSTVMGTVVIGTCKGDIHSLGKNLVASMLKASGLRVIDLGEDVPAEKFVEAAEKNDADIVAISALMTTSMESMRDAVNAVRKSGVRSKVIVGGGPVTDEFAKSVGADGYGDDAVDAVRVVKRLIGSKV